MKRKTLTARDRANELIRIMARFYGPAVTENRPLYWGIVASHRAAVRAALRKRRGTR